MLYDDPLVSFLMYAKTLKPVMTLHKLINKAQFLFFCYIFFFVVVVLLFMCIWYTPVISENNLWCQRITWGNNIIFCHIYSRNWAHIIRLCFYNHYLENFSSQPKGEVTQIFTNWWMNKKLQYILRNIIHL